MRIAVIGVGAMGSVYAGLLADAGHDVCVIDVWQDHMDAIRDAQKNVAGRHKFGDPLTGTEAVLDGQDQRLLAHNRRDHAGTVANAGGLGSNDVKIANPDIVRR